jgi:hypothetical protein
VGSGALELDEMSTDEMSQWFRQRGKNWLKWSVGRR